MYTDTKEEKLYGLIAEFNNSDDLLVAAAKVRDAGYTKTDALRAVPSPWLE